MFATKFWLLLENLGEFKRQKISPKKKFCKEKVIDSLTILYHGEAVKMYNDLQSLIKLSIKFFVGIDAA